MSIPVFHSYGEWHLSGVGNWTVNMTRGMRGSGFESTVLFTGIPPGRHKELDALEIPYSCLDLPAKRRRIVEWRELKRFLDSRAPCIYVPNFDFHRSCAVGILGPDVRVCMVVHSDEECYYDELRRVGADCDSIVCVSTTLRDKVKSRFRRLADRVVHIAYGVATHQGATARESSSGVLRLAYCNRLQQYQKRVFDLPPILERLEQLGVRFHLTIAGDGPDAEELRQRLAAFESKRALSFLGRISNAEVIDVFRSSHVFVLTSDFEGLPISLLEAMSVGCVPVVYKIDSGINDAISHGETGLITPHGDTGAFAEALALLGRDPEMTARLSDSAAARVRERFSLARMCADYEALFSRLISKDSGIARPRRSGAIRIPRDLTFGFRARRRLSSLLGR